MKARKTGKTQIELDLGRLNRKQAEALKALETHKFTCYGGAKFGGKSHLARVAALYYSLVLYPGIRILFVRATFDDIRQNQIEPILRWLPPECYSYNGSTHELKFYNGSSIQFGNWSGLDSETKYQGQEYDFIIIDEATQFTERMFRHLGGCLRGNVGKGFPKRMLLTCNPGGVGHFWVKRLFIDRKFKTVYKEDGTLSEESERPEEYAFIFAKAEDNTEALKENPDYLEDISKMSNSKALREGDWNIMAGQYFDLFDTNIHISKPFGIPAHWQMYRSFDYGLDMFACFWWAVDEDGRCWCIKAAESPNLTVREAAKLALSKTTPAEKKRIQITYAPPDMWARQKDSGKSQAELFAGYDLPLVKADNNRVAGHTIMRDMLLPIPLNDPYVREQLKVPKGVKAQLPGLMFFNGGDLAHALEDLQSIQHDEKNQSDCAKEPHDITHTVDGMRYFCVSRVIQAEAVKPVIEDDYDEPEPRQDWEEFMLGGEAPEGYVNYA